MTNAIIAHNKIVTEIHLIWDGNFYFLNRLRPHGGKPERKTAEQAAEIIRLNESDPAVEISTRGQVEVGSPQPWSWIAKITTTIDEVTP